MSILGRMVSALAVVGIAITAYRVVPMLWDTNILDSIIVAAALAIAVLTQMHRALTGEWP